MSKLKDYLNTTITPDISELPTSMHAAITLRLPAVSKGILTTGYPAQVARKYAALEHQDPKAFVARLILKYQSEHEEMGGWE